MVGWECPINPRGASGLDPEAVHLLWRLVRATERIATAAVTATNSPTSRLWQLVQATERIADAAEDDGPAADRSTDDDSVGDDGPGAGRDDDGDAGAP